MADPRTVIVPTAVRGSPVRFRFKQDSYSVAETQNVTIFILRAGRTDQTVSVDWAITGIGASPSSGTATFNPGVDEQSIQITAGSVVGTGVLKLSNPQLISGNPTVPTLGTRRTVNFQVTGTGVSTYINLYNAFGGMFATASNILQDETKPHFGIPRIANSIGLQPRSEVWPNSSGNAQWNIDFDAHNEANPMCIQAIHQAPLHNTPGFRTTATNKYYGITNWALSTANIDRRDVALNVDGEDHDTIRTNKQTATTNPSKQAGWTVLVSNAATRQHMANIATDVITGSNRTGYYGQQGHNKANYTVWMHDGNSVMTPKSGAALRAVQSTGTIDTVLSSNSQQPIEVRLSNDPALPTSGNLTSSSSYSGADATSYGAVTTVDAIWFLPAGNRGFIGFHVIGYKPASGSRCDLFLKQLSNIAHATQLLTPAAGWRYVLTDDNTGIGGASGDWDQNGIYGDPSTVESFNFATAMEGYYNLLRDQISAETSGAVDQTMRVWNAVSTAHVSKRSGGFIVPHAQTQFLDLPDYEKINGDFTFSKADDDTHNYDCSNTRVERGMRGLYFGKNFVRPNPGGWQADKTRGVVGRLELYGDLNYSSVSTLDAAYARFYWALTRTVYPNFILSPEVDDPGAPHVLEEQFVDLDTGWLAPDPLGVYDEAGGAIGSSGYPVGLWTWSTTQPGDLVDNGRRIYIRRLNAEWLIIVNAADAPAGYNTYAPSHLAGGFTPRNPQDIVTPTDWDNLVSQGVLDASFTLNHFNPATYVNDRITAHLRANSSRWTTSHNYGPRQNIPDDVDEGGPWAYKLSNTPFMLRDNTLNDGTPFNTSVNFGLGPLEGVLLKITEQASPTAFIASKNANGGTKINSVGELFDVNHEAYLWARVTHGPVLLQTVGFIGSSPSNPANLEALHDDNPLFYGVMHDNGWQNGKSYRRNDISTGHYIYDYCNTNPYADTLLHHDVDNVATEMNSSERPASGFGEARVYLPVTDPGLRDYRAKLAVDIMTGSNLTGDNPGGSVDMSGYTGWFHDTTPLRGPRPNAQLRRPFANGTGTIVGSPTYSGSQITALTISNQPGSAVVGEDIFLFNPSGTGFIGYSIATYNNNGSNADLTLEPLPGNAVTQTTLPASGWRFCIPDPNQPTSSADWDRDGTPTGVDVSSEQWGPAWKTYFDLINSYQVSVNGIESGRGQNGISDNFNVKESSGWVHPHQQHELSDYPTAENYTSARMLYKLDQPTNNYRINTVDMTRNMRAIHFAAEHVNPSPNSAMATKPRGVLIEAMIWGSGTSATALDATFARFILALIKTVPDTNLACVHTSGGNDMMMIEESWLDFDTNWTTPSPLGVYTPDDGILKSFGNGHTFVFGTPDWGERGFFRRYGNFLCAMNCADFPGDYGTLYIPSHLPGGYSPRTGNDEITSADFSALYTNSVLQAGETLKHVDFSTYINTRVTNWLQGQTAHWAGFDYGPQQPHPNDGDGAFTLATHPWIARDATLNDGSAVNQGVSYFLGPQEAVFWEIV